MVGCPVLPAARIAAMSWSGVAARKVAHWADAACGTSHSAQSSAPTMCAIRDDVFMAVPHSPELLADSTSKESSTAWSDMPLGVARIGLRPSSNDCGLSVYIRRHIHQRFTGDPR